MHHFLLVALGGAVGAGMRHLVNLAALRLLGANFPWGTLLVNVAGSFAMGVIVELIARRFGASTEMRLFLATGLLGGFTTFSAFSLDIAVLWDRGAAGLALSYAAASVIGSVAALFLGLWVARSFA